MPLQMQIWAEVLFQKRRQVQTLAQTWNWINFKLNFWKQFMRLETHQVCIYGEWPPHPGLQAHLLLLKATAESQLPILFMSSKQHHVKRWRPSYRVGGCIKTKMYSFSGNSRVFLICRFPLAVSGKSQVKFLNVYWISMISYPHRGKSKKATPQTNKKTPNNSGWVKKMEKQVIFLGQNTEKARP